jgi:hypothetical protein
MTKEPTALQLVLEVVGPTLTVESATNRVFEIYEGKHYLGLIVHHREDKKKWAVIEECIPPHDSFLFSHKKLKSQWENFRRKHIRRSINRKA